MLKIGEFSKLSMLTVKTLRYYEKEGLLCPSSVDPQTGYRFYETRQLETAARIKALRQLDFSVDAIRRYLSGEPVKDALAQKERELKEKTYRHRHHDLRNKIFIGGYGNEVSSCFENDP